MNLTITGRHLEVTPAMREYVTTKLQRITRHFDQLVDTKVTLSIENDKDKDRRQHAEPQAAGIQSDEKRRVCPHQHDPVHPQVQNAG